MPTIYFDMDGTIANLYGVENWLEMLRNENVKPYKEAKPMLHFSSFAKLLNRVKEKGYKIGIISWLSKTAGARYGEEIASTKRKWLATHLKSVDWNEINIVPYGYSKNNFCKHANDILFDDEMKNRSEWSGIAYNEKSILEVLKTL